MYRTGNPKFLGTGLGDDEGCPLPDVDCIAMQYYNPLRAETPQRISSYDVPMMERQVRINGLGAVGRPQHWMRAMNKPRLRTKTGQPAIRQRFLNGLAADPPTAPTPVSTTNKPYMVVSDPNAPFVLYAQNAENAPYQPFALFRQYRPAKESQRTVKGSGVFPSQWSYMDGLGTNSSLFATPYVYPVQLPKTLVQDNSQQNAPAITASKAVAGSFGIRNTMQRAINARKQIIQAGYKIGTNVGIRLQPSSGQALVKPQMVDRDPLTRRSLFVEY